MALVFLSAAIAHGQNLRLNSPPSPPDPAMEHAKGYAASPFEARRQAWLAHEAGNRCRTIYDATAWLAADKKPPEEAYKRSYRRMELREDCADFRLHGVLRFLYQFAGHANVVPGMRAHARETVLDFKYWPDEPGSDSMCTWSENHYILFASGAYLAGQLYPEATFTNTGETGREKMARFRPRVMKWLEMRYKTGFSEWLSNVYYDEDIAALVNLVDFSEDQQLATRAAMVLDLLLADMACNSFRGLLASTHGRTYEQQKKWPAKESTSSTARLLFGMGREGGAMGTTLLALSTRYRMPQVLYEIANDTQSTVLNRQRMGIRIEEAARWGLAPDDFEAGMHLLTLEAYAHPRTINLFVDMLDGFDWWNNAFYMPFRAHRSVLRSARDTGVLPLLAYVFMRDLTRNMRPEVNSYTYRTPDYQLSTAQDWRPGFGGDQQHIWQATLGPTATCFTTHPARRYGQSPDYWTGSGTLPRAAQVENVALILYDIDPRPYPYVTNELMYTHAWLPADGFDEIIPTDHWIFARQGDGYLALYTQHPWHWQRDDTFAEDVGREVVVQARRNVWICELGRRADDGTFAQFVARIEAAPVSSDGRSVRYESPSQGLLEFGWEGPLLQCGESLQLHDYPRYDNPYAQIAFPAQQVAFAHNSHWLHLDWETAARNASAWLE